MGGDETRSGYMRYVQGFQTIVPARTTFIDIQTESHILLLTKSLFQLSTCKYFICIRLDIGQVTQVLGKLLVF